MTTVTSKQATGSVVDSDDRFFVTMAFVCAAVAFLGFAPTYWVPLVTGKLKALPIIHVHGLVFFAWTLFFAFQVWLGATNRLQRHRAVGMIGEDAISALPKLVGLLQDADRPTIVRLMRRG